MSIEELGNSRYKFQTTGISFQQNSGSPPLFAFVASSNDLIRFCGVARKSQNLLTNYQRALDERRVTEQITPFFRMSENCSPTALVISLQSSNISQVQIHEDSSNPIGNGISLKKLEIEFTDVDQLSPEEVIAMAKSFLDDRLAMACEADSDEQVEEEEEEEEEEENAIEEGEDDDTTDTEAPVEIGRSMLRDLRDQLDKIPASNGEIVGALGDMLRPALVIDGQHRLFGAAGVEDDIPLLVCSLVNPDWKEQVYQFVVVNDKATGIPKPFITSLAGMSLTTEELGALKGRLSQAGVRLWEVEVMQRLGFDPSSPFQGLIEFKVAGEPDKGLGYQTMKRVGRAWHHPPSRNTGLYKLMQSVYYGNAGKVRTNKHLRDDKWQESNDWYDFFCLFWNEFREKYVDTSLWVVHSNFLKAVSLECLQEVFFVKLNNQGAIFWNCDGEDEQARKSVMKQRMAELIKEFVEKYDVRHFDREWGWKSLNVQQGKEHLKNYFTRINEGQSTTNHPIITGQA